MIRIIDISTAPIANAAEFITVEAPGNYKKPDTIAAYIAEETPKRIAAASTDIDLCRITAVGFYDSDGESQVSVFKTEDEEAHTLELLGHGVGRFAGFVTYNGHAFDLPVMMRRAKYLGVPFPAINLDRYKSPHRDLMLELSDRNPSRYRSLEFYKKRLGMDVGQKPMTGEEESRVFETGKWDELAASVAHDVEVLRRLAIWWGIAL